MWKCKPFRLRLRCHDFANEGSYEGACRQVVGVYANVLNRASLLKSLDRHLRNGRFCAPVSQHETDAPHRGHALG